MQRFKDIFEVIHKFITLKCKTDYSDTEYIEKSYRITLRFYRGEQKQKGQNSETSSENHSSMDHNGNQKLIVHVN